MTDGGRYDDFIRWWLSAPNSKYAFGVWAGVALVVVVAGLVDIFNLREVTIIMASWLGGVTFSAVVTAWRERFEGDGRD